MTGRLTHTIAGPQLTPLLLLPLQVHGAEVCFFAMYVQEYGSDCPEPNTNRVYISYLDSVRYFESSPEGHRTTVYHSMLISYLQYAKDAGYTHAHIWVAPPKQGDDYIFYAHPDEMVAKRMGARRHPAPLPPHHRPAPTTTTATSPSSLTLPLLPRLSGLLKLKEWYERMLDEAKKRKVIDDYQVTRRHCHHRHLHLHLTPSPLALSAHPLLPPVTYQDMLEEYKDIESAADLPMFSGDHWAMSIQNKIIDQTKKSEEAVKKKGQQGAQTAAQRALLEEEQKRIAEEEARRAKQLEEQKKAAAERAAAGCRTSSRETAGRGGVAAQNFEAERMSERQQQAALAAAAGPSSENGAAGGKANAEKQEEQLLNQITEEMRSMRNHFIVVTMDRNFKKEDRKTIVDPVPLLSNEFVDTRSAFLEKCQMYHWQFDELRNAQHSTLMLLYYLHGMHVEAKKRMAELNAQQGGGDGGSHYQARSAGGSHAAAAAEAQRARSSKIEMAMADWTLLLSHANEAAAKETWELPPEELFQRILVQINRSKRDILQEKYNQCRDPSTPLSTKSVFIRVLKRIAESFMSCLLTMQRGGNGGVGNAMG